MKYTLQNFFFSMFSISKKRAIIKTPFSQQLTEKNACKEPWQSPFGVKKPQKVAFVFPQLYKILILYNCYDSEKRGGAVLPCRECRTKTLPFI